MALDAENKLVDLTGEYIHQRVVEQSWFQKNANTVATAGGFVATVLAWVVSQPFAADPRVQTAVLVVGFLLTVLGVKKTPNGWSESQLEKVQNHRAKVIGETKLAVPMTLEAPEDPGTDLSAQVAEFNQVRG
ncbi:hypothetical protein QP927_08585 [Corynebacterium pseudodiphtheriticum]|uniref:hypothetical protein n=1 Tax=Corynebacterium pseudodiphtheriticum TaxID=37637 RepID=UPI00254C1A05|nr:hypothetical protein [Corynebacterium pseudodiphtheriticum]MDK8478920.1 hypothetical protein [Corynebacterium pseudodiphtheriticum]